MLRRFHRRDDPLDLRPGGGTPRPASLSGSHTNGCAEFDLTTESYDFPSGWVLLDSQLIHHSANVTARLYFDTGNGFSDAQSITVPVTRKGRIHELIQLPPRVVGLRWQVMNILGKFDQYPVTLKKVGPIERIVRMLRRIAPTFLKYSRKRRRQLELSIWRMFYDLSGVYRIAAHLRLSPPDWTYRR